MHAVLWSLWLAGCSGESPAPVDSDLPPVDSDSVESAALVGTPPASPVAAPEFQATNSEGSSRSREDLLGRPHVLWFFPSAGTFG